jgi:tryptophan-rich sensory protein
MGIAAWLVWRRPQRPARRAALVLFGVQLALNGIWTPVFFGLRSIQGALFVIAALWVAILLTLIAFAKESRTASGLLVPYLAWVSFALTLNFYLWRLNA